MKIIKNIIKIFSIILFLSCEAEVPLTEGEVAYNNKAKILLSMEDLTLTVSVDNFEQISIMSIGINFDTEELSVTNFVNGDFDNLFNTNSYSIENSSDFIFENVSGDGVLFKLNFESNGNYEGITISPSNVEIFSSNNESLYMQCADSKYQDRRSCGAAGFNWAANDEEFIVQSVCYIDEGVIIQGTLNTSEPFSDWEATGNFVWSNAWCYGIDWD